MQLGGCPIKPDEATGSRMEGKRTRGTNQTQQATNANMACQMLNGSERIIHVIAPSVWELVSLSHDPLLFTGKNPFLCRIRYSTYLRWPKNTPLAMR